MRAALWITMGAWLFTAGCSDQDREQTPATQPAQKLNVVATIFPIASVVEAIAGPDVQVHTLLTGAQSPHEFTLRPAQAEVLGRSAVLFMVGLGADAWAGKAADSAGGRHLRVVKLGEEPDFLAAAGLAAGAPAAEHHHEYEEDGAAKPVHNQPHEHDPLVSQAVSAEQEHLAEQPEHRHEGPIDPHVWLDPVFMQHFARRIAQELGQADPSHAQDFQRRAQEFIAQLQELDGQYRRRLADLSSRYIVTYHSAFGYLARRYGLEPISVYGIQGDGLGSSRIESVTDFIRRHNVKVLFTEPQYPPEKLQDLARRMGLRLAALDDLGSPDRPGYTSYLEMMRTNLDTLERNLKD